MGLSFEMGQNIGVLWKKIIVINTQMSKYQYMQWLQTNNNKEDVLQAYIYGLVQDCSISSALAMEILQSHTKPSMWSTNSVVHL